VANIRAAVETMLDYPDMDADGQRQFAGIIQDEAQRLSAQVEQATPRPEEALGDPTLVEEILAGDLLSAIERRLTGEGLPSPGAASVPAAPDDVWLSVDSFGVIRTVADLVAWVRDKRGVPAVTLAVEPMQRYAGLDVRWQGTPLDSDAMAEWSSRPGVREWLDRYGCESWSGHDASGAYVRLLLPRAAPVHVEHVPVPGARVVDRSEFYDFDLFRVVDAGASTEWDDKPLGDLAYTVFDTETTGLSPDDGDEIISIGAVRVVNRRLLRTETFEQLVDPRRRIPPASYAVHGISGEMVRGQPVIERVLPEFARFAEDTVLVGHEVGFDMRFIARKEEAAGVRFTQPLLDTRLLSAIVHPEHERHGLDAIAERLGVSVVGRHTALGDALLTGEVFVRLLGLLESQGFRTLGEVRAAAARATVQTTTFP
jgi:DNA polymerase-3 subunit epsilon